MKRNSKFVPTHEITVPGDSSRLTIPVMLVDGKLYQQTEWARNAPPIWIMVAGTAMMNHGMTSPDTTIRRLGRGSDPHGPTKATKRVMINLRLDQHTRYVAAAKLAGVKVSTWAVRMLDAAVTK